MLLVCFENSYLPKIIICYYYISLYLILEHGIHPPSRGENPWMAPEIEDTEHVFSSVAGVYHVYESPKHLERQDCIEYEYPRLDTFITDMNSMCQMIADGPL